jgi:hypothetical protein
MFGLIQTKYCRRRYGLKPNQQPDNFVKKELLNAFVHAKLYLYLLNQPHERETTSQ